MAYAALTSLMYTLEQHLMKPDQSFVCTNCIQEHVQSLYQNLSHLQLFLEDTTTNDIQTLKVIEKRIRDVVYKAEDRVDSSLRRIILADREDQRQKACTSFYEELLKVEQQVYFLKKEVTMIEFDKHGSKSEELADCTENRERACELFEEEWVKVEEDVHSLRKKVMQIELNKHGSRSTELATTPSSTGKSKIEENTVVGMEDDFNTIFNHLTSQTDELIVIPIFGMGGIGKTTLARKVYDDSYIRSRFDKHAWVTISEEYNERKMLLELVSSITGRNQEMSNDELMELVYKGLNGRRFIIAIDDIWSTEAWDQMQRIFPNDDNKSRILLTTRLKHVADYVSCPGSLPHSKSFLSLEDSWNLFTKKIFKKDPCPPHLEEIAKHIVQQCRGLPLSIVVVAGLLGKMEPTHENWEKVKENMYSFFGTVSGQCQSILSLSYSCLPQHLRACFLYIGGFPEDGEIDVSKLIRLWIAEQFIKARSNKKLELVAEEYLEELVDRSLILTGTQRPDGRMITCKIHDLLRQLCLREAHTENIVHIMNRNVSEATYDQRRVILLSDLQKKRVYPIRHSSSIIRTFISMKYFSSNFSEGIFSIVSQLKLLKVLDVLSVEYDFSSVIPQLVHLRYVAANIKEALSLAKLKNLQTIILKYLERRKIKQIPVDIWTVSEIRYVDIIWPLYICNPIEAKKSLFLNNLQRLDLYDSPFVAEIIRRAPNLKNLRIDGYKTDYFDSLNLLGKLETLYIRGKGTIDRMIFPPNLKELRLSFVKMPWEVVNLLANYLPNLEVLKGCYAFQGRKWKLDEDVVFHKLKYLRIIVGHLERWEVGSDNFPMLEKLVLVGLYHLEEIPESIGEIMTLKLIEVYDCNFALENSAKRIQQEQESLGNYELQVRAT